MAEEIRPQGRTENDSAAPDPRAGGDPLAELARLIGQDSLFDQMRKDAARAEMRAAPQAPSNDPTAMPDWFAHARPSQGSRSIEPADERRRPAPAAGHAYDTVRKPAADPAPARAEAEAPEDDYSDAQGLYHEPEGVEPEQYYAAEAPPEDYQYADEAYDDQAYDETPEPKKKRGGLMTVAAVLGIAAIGTAGAFGYKAMTGASDKAQPPVIKADQSPTKIAAAPSDATARFIADRTQGERVVPRQEEPLDMPKSTGPKSVTTTGIPGPSVQSPVVLASTATPTPAVGSEPKRVKTVAIRPDGSAASDSSARPTVQTASAQRPGQPVRTASLSPNAPTGSTNPVAAAPAPAAAGGYVVQLVSNKSEAEAQSAFKGLQTKYPGVLANRQALIRRVDLGDKGTYYRAQVGPFASADQANDLCGNLKSAGGQCIVQRN